MGQRLIDANALILTIQHEHMVALSYIDAAPTVDAVEVVHGKWIGTETPGRRYCSRCGKNPDTIHTYPQYCPNCGANMETQP